MITTTELQERISRYRDYCNENKKEPSFLGLAKALVTSAPTIKHIYYVEYRNGRPYTHKPHILRVVSNDDFELVRDLYDRRG